MNDNRIILHRKLEHLHRMRSDLEHSLSKMPTPLATIQHRGILSLTPDERETLSAFTTRFALYQEFMGKTMRSIAIEEESATSPFGAILALMEKMHILDNPPQWTEVRSLRNSIHHEYEDRADELLQILSRMVATAPWLMNIHEKLHNFVTTTYADAR